MSYSVFQQNTQNSARNAMIATFQGESDKSGIADKFGREFASRFCQAVKSYLSKCIVLPVGGPITPSPPSDLTNSIVNAARNAMIATFQGESDKSGIADKFGNKFNPVGPTISTYMSTCIAIPGTPATAGLTPGGAITCPPTNQIEAILNTSAKMAMIATFQGESDKSGIADKFGNKMKEIAKHFHAYVSTSVASPGGGPLITT